MELRKVTAIVRCTALEDVERKLRGMHVSGFTSTQVKGCGEYENLYSRDPKTLHARIEVFADEARAEEVARAIVEAAHTGAPGDGIVAILPVESIWRVRTKRLATTSELH